MVNKPIYYLCCNFIWKKKNGYSSFSWHWIRHNLWWIRVSKSVLLWLFAILCACLIVHVEVMAAMGSKTCSSIFRKSPK